MALAIFDLESADKTGVTKRQKLELLEKTTGNRPDALSVPSFPGLATTAWELWLDINRGRSSNGMGPSLISWQDIEAWSRTRGRKLTYSELELIRAIDSAFLETQQEN